MELQNISFYAFNRVRIPVDETLIKVTSLYALYSLDGEGRMEGSKANGERKRKPEERKERRRLGDRKNDAIDLSCKTSPWNISQTNTYFCLSSLQQVVL